jgi:hypothetical protein
MNPPPVIHHHICQRLPPGTTQYRYVIAYYGTVEGRPVEVVARTDFSGERTFDCCFEDEIGSLGPRSVTSDLLEAIRRYGFRDGRLAGPGY